MHDNTCVCIPTLNEEESIDTVISDIIKSGYKNILVIDGGSSDDTEKIAREFDINFVEQTKKGAKGAAIRESFEVTDSDILVFIDGDDTYEPNHIDRLVKPVKQNNYDHVIGNRFNDMKSEAMSTSHKIGNKSVNSLFAAVHGNFYKDILSGFRAVKRESFEDINLESDGFEIETELIIKSIKNNHKVKVVPTSYYPRKGDSKLNGVGDGIKIIKKIFNQKFD